MSDRTSPFVSETDLSGFKASLHFLSNLTEEDALQLGRFAHRDREAAKDMGVALLAMAHIERGRQREEQQDTERRLAKTLAELASALAKVAELERDKADLSTKYQGLKSRVREHKRKLAEVEEVDISDDQLDGPGRKEGTQGRKK